MLEKKKKKVKISDFGKRPEKEARPIEELPSAVKTSSEKAGFSCDNSRISGSYFQSGDSVLLSAESEEYAEKLEVLPIKEAVKRKENKPYFREYFGKLHKGKDEFSKLDTDRGYFIRIFEGRKIERPIQACMHISAEGSSQLVHNLVIAEKDSEASMITGCASLRNTSGLHAGISEMVIKEGSNLTFSMIHSWGKNMHVRPRTTALIEKDARFASNYICMSPIGSIDMYPLYICEGENSKCSSNSIISGIGNSFIDTGSEIRLVGRKASGTITSRVIAYDRSEIITRGRLTGLSPDCRAHLECRGLVLSPHSSIVSIPELEARTRGCDLSHEAAVGKIKSEEIYYLMSRGIPEGRAVSLIAQGFLSPEDIKGLSPEISAKIRLILGNKTN